MVVGFSEAAIKLAGAAARDPVQRVSLGQGSAIPATTMALQCLIPSLATKWKYEKQIRMTQLEFNEGLKDTLLPVIDDCAGKADGPNVKQNNIISILPNGVGFQDGRSRRL
jgi:hypothetical protein